MQTITSARVNRSEIRTYRCFIKLNVGLLNQPVDRGPLPSVTKLPASMIDFAIVTPAHITCKS